ncbi:sulfotransferase [Thermodesulfobacteriota bacterium]
MIPIFLVASRRSGTTLLRLMLNSHPNLHWERGWEFVTRIIGFNGEAPSQGQMQVLQKMLNLPTLAHFSSKSSSDDLQPLRSLLETYMVNKINNKQIKHFGTTVHVDTNRLYFLWPYAKYIHLVRDPRDIAISVVKLGWESTYWHAATHWIKAERDWRLLADRIAPESWIEIKYEDLINQAEVELTKILEFIGVPYSDQVFNYTKTSSYGLPDPSLIERWRGQLSSSNTSLVETRTAGMMQSYGYEITQPIYKPNIFESTILDIKNLLLTSLGRMKNYGLLTYCIGILVNRFHLAFLKGILKKRIERNQKQSILSLESKYRNVSKDN